MASLLSRRAAAKLHHLLNPNPLHHLKLLAPSFTVSPPSSPTPARHFSSAHTRRGTKPTASPTMPRSPCWPVFSQFNPTRPFSSPPPELPRSPGSSDPSQSEEDAEEALEVVGKLRKASSDLSWSLIALGAAHFGHWASKSMRSPPPPPPLSEELASLSSLMAGAAGVLAFVFPCVLAYLTWQVTKALQAVEGGGASGRGKSAAFSLTSKAINQIEGLLMRARVVALLCVVGVCLEPFINNAMSRFY